MEEKKAIQVLIEIAQLAQSKGILSLDDAVLAHQAINKLKTK